MEDFLKEVEMNLRTQHQEGKGKGDKGRGDSCAKKTDNNLIGDKDNQPKMEALERLQKKEESNTTLGDKGQEEEEENN